MFSLLRLVGACSLGAFLIACSVGPKVATDAAGLDGFAADGRPDQGILDAPRRDTRADLGGSDARPDRTPDVSPPDSARPDLATLPAKPPVSWPRSAITAAELALVINTDDPVSVAIGAYYQTKRAIPAANVVQLKLPTSAKITALEFAAAKAQVDAVLGPNHQAIALAWLKPYKVDCMSITTAFALGYDKKYCSTPCSATAASPYYDRPSTRPFTDHQLRPTMMLAAVDEAGGKLLVDRGVAADGTFPPGKGYFLRTTDTARSVRYGDFSSTVTQWNRPDGIVSEYIDNSGGGGSNVLANQTGVLFYLTGLTKVAQIETNSYQSGAIADHLTSFGGTLDGTGQMSIVRWLEAGATGSYGTCSEPCNYTAKFPRASVLLRHYFSGNTLLEAYWKSVQWPGEGVFVGEPLARPFGTRVSHAGKKLTLTTTIMAPGKSYELRGKRLDGVWEPVQGPLSVTTYGRQTIVVDPMQHAAYDLVILP